MTLKHISARLAAAVLTVSTIITPALAANGTVTTEGSPLRLRSEASIEGSVLNKLPTAHRWRSSPVWTAAGIRWCTRVLPASSPPST